MPLFKNSKKKASSVVEGSTQLHPQSSASQSHYMPLFKNSKKKASSVVEGSTQLHPQSSASQSHYMPLFKDSQKKPLLLLKGPPNSVPKAVPPSANTQPAIMKPTEEPPAYSQPQQTQVRAKEGPEERAFNAFRHSVTFIRQMK